MVPAARRVSQDHAVGTEHADGGRPFDHFTDNREVEPLHDQTLDGRPRTAEKQLIVLPAGKSQFGGLVRKGPAQLLAEWQVSFLDPGGEAGRAGNLVQVLHQAIAYVHAAADAGLDGSEAGVDSRERALVGFDEASVAGRGAGGSPTEQPEAGGGIAKRARDSDGVSGLGGAAAEEERLAGCPAGRDTGEGDRYGEKRGPHDVAPADLDAIGVAAVLDAAVKRDGVFDAEFGRQGECNQRKVRFRSHSGDVADVDGDCLPARVAPWGPGRQKVDAFDQRIGRPDRRPSGGSADHGVVADVDDKAGAGRRCAGRGGEAEFFAQQLDQAKLAGFGYAHRLDYKRGLADPHTGPGAHERGCNIDDVRVLVVADIHSNLCAFETVIRDAESTGPIDAIWALGDLVGYGPEPGGCLNLLRSYQHRAVAGNHDRAAVGLIGTQDFNAYAAAAARWTAGVLSDEDRAYLLALPDSAVEGDFSLVHGSLRDPVWEYLLSSAAADEHLARQTTPYGFIGHSHLQLTFVEHRRGQTRGSLVASGDEIELGEHRLVANPGGLGQPRDGDPRTAYALLDTGDKRLRFRRIEYDIARTQKEMRGAGLPDYLIERLARGR